MEPVAAAPASKKNGLRLRRGCFTLNNPTDQEYHWLTTTWIGWPKNNPTWMIIGKEVGETGTSHLQGAFTLSGQVAFSTIKMWPGFRRAHLEPMRGTPLDSKAYCSKQDLEPFEFGILPTPGKRSDVADAVEAVKSGMTMRELTNDHAVAVVKFFKGLTVLRSLRAGPRDPDALPPTVYWLHGKTGTGKTRSAWELGCAVSAPSEVWFAPAGTQWFDGYDGQRVAIFDDFRPKGTKFEFLLRLCDRYPLQVPFKGGFVNWKPDWIIFTTPHSIAHTFEARQTHRPEDVAQLERRVSADFCLDWPEERDKLEQVLSEARSGGSAEAQSEVRVTTPVADGRRSSDSGSDLELYGSGSD